MARSQRCCRDHSLARGVTEFLQDVVHGVAHPGERVAVLEELLEDVLRVEPAAEAEVEAAKVPARVVLLALPFVAQDLAHIIILRENVQLLLTAGASSHPGARKPIKIQLFETPT